MVDAGVDLNAYVGENVQFSGSYQGAGGAAEIAWDFNDDGAFDSMATGSLTPSHSFAYPGTYQVALKITDADTACTVIDFLNVTVQYEGPTVEAGADQTVNGGATVSFSGSFTETDGIVTVSGIAWDFDWNGVFSADSTGTLTPTWQYATPGVYTAALLITDENGADSIDFLDIVVNDVSVFVNAGPDMTIAAGETFTFLGMHRMAGTVAPAGIEWDFAYDGVLFDADASATGNLSPERQFNTTGTYTVALRVTDDGAASLLDTAIMTVVNARPVVTINPTLTATEGQSASFSAAVSCPDPVQIDWDFDFADGTFAADSGASGQLNPSHVYAAAGNYLAAVRVTNTVGGATRLAEVLVTVNNVAPTATAVTTSGTFVEGSPVTFTVSGISDPNSATTFDFEADWTGNGEFASIPIAERTTDPTTGAVSFSHVYDDNGTYPVTIRVADTEGGSTDYTQTITIANAAPSVTLSAVGTTQTTVGPGVPIRFNVTDPSHADHTAGFSYFYSINGAPFIQTSGDFYLPTPGQGQYPWYTVQAYAADKDGVGPTHQANFTVDATATTVFENYGGGSVRLNWTGGGPVVLGSYQSYDFQTIISGLTVTLLTSGTTYSLTTNGSIASIDYDAGVQAVDLSVSTTSSSYNPVADGSIGAIHLPAGSATLGSSRLSVSARGDLDAIIGPNGSGKLWAEAGSLSLDDLNGSITGLDHVAGIYARWLGDSGDDEVWTRHGLDYLSVYGIRGKLTSCCQENPEDLYALGSTISIGHGGAAEPLELGRVNSFSTAGAVESLRIELLTGSVNVERGSVIDELYIEDTLGETELNGADYAELKTLFLGEEASLHPPALQYFPLGLPLVISNNPAAAPFWRAMDPEMKNLLQGSGYRVHHTRFQCLERVFVARGVLIHEVSSLRAVHPDVHLEITRRQNNWLDEQARLVTGNQNARWATHRNVVLREVARLPEDATPVSNAFWQRLTEFQEAMEIEYRNHWISATDSEARVRQVYRRMDGARRIAAFQLGEGARARRLLPWLGRALAIFGILESALTAGNLLYAGHTPQQEENFQLLRVRYQGALNRALERGDTPEKETFLVPFKNALFNYMRSIGVQPEVVNNLDYSVELYLAPLR